MAEAHSAAALSFQVTHDGVSVSYDQELLRDIWHAFSRSYRRRIARFKNNFLTGYVWPANVHSFVFVMVTLGAFALLRRDISFGFVTFVNESVLSHVFGIGIISHLIAIVLCGALIWFTGIQLIRLSLKLLLGYKGWMYEDPHEKKVSTVTMIWLGILHLISRSKPMLHSFQGALPHLPLPSLADTLEKHLRSLRPLYNDDEYNELVELSERFRKGIGRRLQRYLIIKSWMSVNYVTDWWEEFVYLRQRSPIMVNSNYYGFDTLFEHPTQKQAARAANITWAALQFRRLVERQEVTPFSVSSRNKVPFCTMQYERLFNSCRIPGEEKDDLRRWDDIKYVAVYCRGAWFRLPIHTGKRLLEPAELQLGYQTIIDTEIEKDPIEHNLAALTAGERIPWARARRQYFSSGINKTSLHIIEKAAFCVILDDDNAETDQDGLDRWAHVLLHGNANNRWFDKSFNFCISKNGRVGINVEHSWGDAAITAHFMEYCLLKDLFQQGYDADGNTIGEVAVTVQPERLQWELNDDLIIIIKDSLTIARSIAADVEMALLVWNEYGKGVIKKLGVSPDAFMQMTLQLTYFRNQNHFSLTYEASMTRLFREGRTETVRSCTIESCAFVKAMLNPAIAREERLRLLKIACKYHQELYRDAMCGKGVDRHLFALYVVKRYLEEESPFLDKIFPPTYLLSTSQTPLNQCDEETKNLSAEKKTTMVSAGGGFGPVSDTGYGVSYIIAGENLISFHISSKRSAANTSSKGFRSDLVKSLREMKALLANK